MRAKEFTINIPINIRFNGNGDPEIDFDQDLDPAELDDNPTFVPPLQQELELTKSAQGKKSDVIDKITADGIKSADTDVTGVDVPRSVSPRK